MRPIQKLNPDQLRFIENHLKVDVVKLRLKYHQDRDKTYLIDQIYARQKLKKKLPEWVSKSQIQFPTGLSLEQASSQATACLKAANIGGDEFIDLTGGLGVDAYYLSQSFNSSVYVEKQAELSLFAQHNFDILASKIKVINADATRLLQSSEADFIYLDPHRRDQANRKQFLLSDYDPNVIQMLPQLCINGRTTLIKTSPMLDINMAINQLLNVAEVWVISVGNECKEVLYLLQAKQVDSVLRRCWNLQSSRIQYFEHAPANKEVKPDLTAPQSYLYEPNASVFKANLQDELAQSFQLTKLAANSHVYTSPELQPDYPGRTYQVKRIWKAWDKELKGGRYNLVNRNFPEKNKVIEKRMRFKPSDRDFILATSLQNGKSVFIESRLVSTTE